MSTGIEWTDEVWNPIRGCSRVSEGCRNCYAETLAGRFCGPGQPYEGLVQLVVKEKVLRRDFADGRVELRKHETRETRWTGEVRFVAEHLADPLRWRKPRRIFVNSMSDLFHEALTNEQIAAVFGVMAAAPQHTFQVLTKRARRMREWFEWVQSHDVDPWTWCHAAALDTETQDGPIHRLSSGGIRDPRPWPLPNVWLGASVENQAAADERIPELLATPAAVRAVSAEPLLGPLDLRAYLGAMPSNAADFGGIEGVRRGISWLIAGCESGRNARPCDVDWLRSLRDQCSSAQVPFFLKQAKVVMPEPVATARPDGSICNAPIESGPDLVHLGSTKRTKPGGIISLPYLDGVQWTQRPEVRR